MSKHTTLDQLKMLAQRTKTEIDAVESKSLVGIKVNGTALAIADKMVNILIGTGATNGTLSVNGTDVAVKGLAALAYKAQVSESDLDAALTAVLAAKAAKADVDTLIGTDTGKSVRTIANEELAAQLIPEGAQESLNTLTEIAQWIQDHPDDAAAMESISAGATKVEASEINGNIKIDGEETTVYTHPTTTAVAAGFKKVGNDDKGHVVLGADVTKQDIVALGIPAQDTTYQPATTEANGLMSKEDKTKLDGMEVALDTEVTAMLNEVFGTTENGQETA